MSVGLFLVEINNSGENKTGICTSWESLPTTFCMVSLGFYHTAAETWSFSQCSKSIKKRKSRSQWWFKSQKLKMCMVRLKPYKKWEGSVIQVSASLHTHLSFLAKKKNPNTTNQTQSYLSWKTNYRELSKGSSYKVTFVNCLVSLVRRNVLLVIQLPAGSGTNGWYEMYRWELCHLRTARLVKRAVPSVLYIWKLGKFLDLIGVKKLGWSLITCFKNTVLFQTSDCFEIASFWCLESLRKRTAVYLYLILLWYSMP